MSRRPRASLVLLGGALLGLALVLMLAPARGQIRLGGGVFAPAATPEISLVLAARDTEYCGYRTACGPGGRTDTILYVRLRGSEASLVAIPRDTAVGQAGESVRINSIYGRAGAQGLKRAVEDTLGLAVENYVILTFETVTKLVDAVDGIEVNLPAPMRYTDEAAGLYINFPAGKQHLDGKDAVKYMRFRYWEGSDLGRLDRVKEVLAKVAAKAGSPRTLAKLPGLVDALWKDLETDLEVSRLLQFLPYARNLQLKTATLPTTEDGPFLRVEPAARAEFLSKFMGLATPVPGPETAAVPHDLKILLVDRSGAGEGEKVLQGLGRIGLALPQVSRDKLAREQGVYVSQAGLEAGQAYAEALHLPLFTPYRVYPAGYDVVIVLTAATVD